LAGNDKKDGKAAYGAQAMPTRAKPDLLEAMRAVFLREELRAVSDAQLLTRYVAQREDGAFETIMRRHGAMVLGMLL
jgi:hypothetical protein